MDITADPREGLNWAIEVDFDLILLDLMMPGLNGEEVLRLLKPLRLQHRVVVVSAYGGNEYRARTRDLGAAAYVQKPVNPEDLRRIVDDLVQGKQKRVKRRCRLFPITLCWIGLRCGFSTMGRSQPISVSQPSGFWSDYWVCWSD